MRRLRAEARRRHVSLAAVVRAAVDQAVPGDDERRNRDIDALLATAGTVSSGTGTVAHDHDAILAGERW